MPDPKLHSSTILEDSKLKGQDKLFVFAEGADPSYIIRVNDVPGAKDLPSLLAGIKEFQEALDVLDNTYGIPTPNPWFVIGKEVTEPKDGCVYTVCERITGVVLDEPENATPEIYFQLLGKLTRYHIDVIFSEGATKTSKNCTDCLERSGAGDTIAPTLQLIWSSYKK